MSINHQNMNLAANYGSMPQQPAPQVIFELVNNEPYVNNYLVAPGNTCYFLDTANQKFYEKTYDGYTSYDLSNPEVHNRFATQPQVQNGLTKEDVAAMIADALSKYNPHIPKKERKGNE